MVVKRFTDLENKLQAMFHKSDYSYSVIYLSRENFQRVQRPHTHIYFLGLRYTKG